MSRFSQLWLAVFLLLTACGGSNPGEMDRDEEIQVNTYKGKGYMERHKAQMALPALRRVQELVPDDVDNLILLGSAYYLLERPVQAQATWQQVLVLRPGMGEVHNRLGVVLLRLDQPKEAREHFLLALNDPRYLTPEETYLNLAMMEKNNNNPAKMLEFLQKALERKANHIPSHVELAGYYYRLGDMVQEQDHLNAILSVEPNSPEVLEKLANSYQKSGDIARSQNARKKIAQIARDTNERAQAVRRFDKRDEVTHEDQ